jgi:hypothetical protein
LGDLPTFEAIIVKGNEDTKIGAPIVGDVLSVAFEFDKSIETRNDEEGDPLPALTTFRSNGTTPIGTINPKAAVTYEWFARGPGGERSIGIGATYTVLAADQGHTIRVKVTAGGSIMGEAVLFAGAAVVSTDEGTRLGIRDMNTLTERREIVVPGSRAGTSINLWTETLTLPQGFIVASFSVDGGQKWRKGPIRFDRDIENGIGGLLNRNLELVVSSSVVDSKNPRITANEIRFPRINARPRMNRLALNYEIGATVASWLLVGADRKNTATFNQVAVEGIEIATFSREAGAGPFGTFWGNNGTINGIEIEPMGENGRPARVTYMIRTGATAVRNAADDGWIYTAASRPRRITAAGEGRAPNIRERNGVISYRAGTLVNGELMRTAGTIDIPGTYKFRIAAAARRPASAEVTMTIPAATP